MAAQRILVVDDEESILKVVRYADAASFYINDQNVAFVTLPAPSGGVWVGLTASNYGTSPSSVRFDNFHFVGMPYVAAGAVPAQAPGGLLRVDEPVAIPDPIATPVR